MRKSLCGAGKRRRICRGVAGDIKGGTGHAARKRPRDRKNLKKKRQGGEIVEQT